MLLAIDCGNTNTVFAAIQGRDIQATWRLATERQRTADEYAAWLTQLLSLSSITAAQIDCAILATVVPETLFNLRLLVRRYFDCEPLVVGDSSLTLPVKANIDRPEEAGADRLVNAVAAAERYGAPLIVIDFGTATTFDIVDRDGNYAGGAIAPGINLSLEALRLAAAKLPAVAIKRPPQVIGKSTVPAMQSGIYWGYVGLIEGLVARMRQEFGAPMKVVATGGLAPLFEQATDVIDYIDPDLTLRGLALIYHAHRRATETPARGRAHG